MKLNNKREFIQIIGRKNYELEIEILGVAPFNFCTFIVKAKNKQNQPTNIKCKWYR